MIAVAERHRDHLRVRRPAKFPDRPPAHLLESAEAHVAGRVGLGVAVREHLDLGREAVAARLVDVGGAVREMAASLADWDVVHPQSPAGAITSLRPTGGQDAVRARERLLEEHHVLTSVCLPWRAPGETIAEPWLRLSPHVDLTDDDLERIAKALRNV
jgi:pyridoxal 5-phosphate dependent beta-lyase